jgi:hypothetical protein
MEGADALDVGSAVGDGVVSLTTVVVVAVVAPVIVVVVVAVVASEESAAVLVVASVVVVAAAASASEEVEEAVDMPPGTTHPASQAKTQLGSVPQPESVVPVPP